MADFDEFNDGNTEGANVNITDSDNPAEKVGVTNSELNVNNIIDNVSAPIHTAVGTSAVRIDNPILSNRKEVDIQANKNIWIGFVNTITTSSGYFLALKKGQIVALDLGPNEELWAISDTASVGSDDCVLTQGARF